MNIIQTIKENRLYQVVLVLLAVYLFFNWDNLFQKDSFESIPAEFSLPQYQQSPSSDLELAQEASREQVNMEAQQIDRAIANKPTLSTEDLLPKYDAASDFVKQNPTTTLLQEQNFLQSGYHIGINTVLQSNGKTGAYLDLRSAPPIPKNNSVSPWNVSSSEQPPGYGRRFLEIGS